MAENQLTAEQQKLVREFADALRPHALAPLTYDEVLRRKKTVKHRGDDQLLDTHTFYDFPRLVSLWQRLTPEDIAAFLAAGLMDRVTSGPRLNKPEILKWVEEHPPE